MCGLEYTFRKRVFWLSVLTVHDRPYIHVHETCTQELHWTGTGISDRLQSVRPMELGSPEQPDVLAAAVQQVCQPGVLYWMVTCVIVQPPATPAALPDRSALSDGPGALRPHRQLQLFLPIRAPATATSSAQMEIFIVLSQTTTSSVSLSAWHTQRTWVRCVSCDLIVCDRC